MQALILAAGSGRRLRDPRGRPKCLRKVGGVPLVHHQIRALARAGVDDVVIVVGFEQTQIRTSVDAAARYVVNRQWAETNSMSSFLSARPLINDDVIVINSDLFCHPDLPALLLEGDGDALLYDSSSGNEAEQMKVRVADGHLVQMSKRLSAEHSCGENVGMLRLSQQSLARTAATARAIEAGGGGKAWLAAAINCLAMDHTVRCIDVAGLPWVEIDFPSDLAYARSTIFPLVANALDDEETQLLRKPALLRSVS